MRLRDFHRKYDNDPHEKDMFMAMVRSEESSLIQRIGNLKQQRYENIIYKSNINQLNDELVDIQNELWNMSSELPQALDIKKYANDPQEKAWFIKQVQKKESYLIQSLNLCGLTRESRIYKQLEEELTDVQNVIITMSSDLPPDLDGKEETR